MTFCTPGDKTFFVNMDGSKNIKSLNLKVLKAILGISSPSLKKWSVMQNVWGFQTEQKLVKASWP